MRYGHHICLSLSDPSYDQKASHRIPLQDHDSSDSSFLFFLPAATEYSVAQSAYNDLRLDLPHLVSNSVYLSTPVNSIQSTYLTGLVGSGAP